MTCPISAFKGKGVITYYPDREPKSKALEYLYNKYGTYAVLIVDYRKPLQAVQNNNDKVRPDGMPYDCLECQINDFKNGYMWGRYRHDANCKYNKHGKYLTWVKYKADLQIIRKFKLDLKSNLTILAVPLTLLAFIYMIRK